MPALRRSSKAVPCRLVARSPAISKLAACCAALLTVAAFVTAPARADLDERQGKLLSYNCVQCHARPETGAPVMGNPADWTVRNEQGMDRLLANTVLGLRGMPPLGYCSACSEQDLRELIKVVSGIEVAGQ
jgi:cytochrome c5